MILVQSDTDPSGPSPTEEDDNLAVTVLTIDHGLDIPDECARVEKSGGIVATLPGDPDEFNGPLRVWRPEMTGPGLAMSRSIGDSVGHEIGVISTPEITVHKISSTDRFLVVGSDGLFEFMENERVAGIVWRLRRELKDA
eukprot:273392_1